jgi:hypothetical protein
MCPDESTSVTVASPVAAAFPVRSSIGPELPPCVEPADAVLKRSDPLEPLVADFADAPDINDIEPPVWLPPAEPALTTTFPPEVVLEVPAEMDTEPAAFASPD